MNATVKLSDIVDGLQMQGVELSHYLHVSTGKVYPIMDEEIGYAEHGKSLDDIPDWQKGSVEIAKKILSTDEFIMLPEQYDVNEYAMMERFCLSLSDDALRNEMYYSIKGAGAFRRFKDNIYRYEIQDEWYQYREDEYYKYASEWCEVNKIPYVDDRPV
ncbi:hypothetical protein JXJ21_13435 [candidate division KSB1 bacterium]|nr:hypothetical protein [candidate division KSB1 bacterium]